MNEIQRYEPSYIKPNVMEVRLEGRYVLYTDHLMDKMDNEALRQRVGKLESSLKVWRDEVEILFNFILPELERLNMRVTDMKYGGIKA
jgi:hypothetical protein